jgi:putative ATP-dependent endonuclease of the OLD family
VKLTRIEVTNYRSLFRDGADRNFTLDLGEGMNAFIGPNNCGKSNVLRAVAFALDPAFPVDIAHDIPAGMQWAYPRVTVDLRPNKAGPESTLLRYADEYERSVAGVGERTYASEGLIRLTAVYQSLERGGLRYEYLYARGAGNRQGNAEKLNKALAQLRKTLRFILIESGQSLESVLAGKFREILHTVIQEHLREQFVQADSRRGEYVEGLQADLLDPLRERIDEVVRSLFPEVTAVSLVPQVSSIDETLANVAINLTDAVESSLATKGTGVRGAVLVAMLRYLADNGRRSMVFAVEEPEAFLHPGAQEELRDDLDDLGHRRDVTLLVTTHSPFVVSRDSSAKIVALAKDGAGRTTVTGTARGDEPHASLLGGLFRDTALVDLLDRASQVPTSSQGVLIVEGLGDKRYLELVAEKAKRPDLLAGLHVAPAGGATKTVFEGVITKQLTQKPVAVLLDSDEMGRAARDRLIKQFGFRKGHDITMYGETFPGGADDIEAEDLFPSALIQSFIDQHGEDRVLNGKSRRSDGEWHYDLNATGKDSIAEFLRSHLRPEDCTRWLALLEKVRSRMGIARSDMTVPSGS